MTLIGGMQIRRRRSKRKMQAGGEEKLYPGAAGQKKYVSRKT